MEELKEEIKRMTEEISDMYTLEQIRELLLNLMR